MNEFSLTSLFWLANTQPVSIGVLTAFAFLATLVLGGAILTITRRNLISAVMALVITFFGLAGLYIMLSAHFLAAIQILVYAGGIMVLFIFVIMVLNHEEAEPWSKKGIFGKTLAAGGILYLCLRLGLILYRYGVQEKATLGRASESFGTVQQMGQTLFTDFLFPFEAISLLLLIAIIGAVVVARGHVAHSTSSYENLESHQEEGLSHPTEGHSYGQ